ncbi:MAG: choice-of-anchor J domain-containing protein [Muribaculaceae bacterium]|nr:choice-of-anchor J domain-containing protein [Muribaculaceae bacterium]
MTKNLLFLTTAMFAAVSLSAQTPARQLMSAPGTSVVASAHPDVEKSTRISAQAKSFVLRAPGSDMRRKQIVAPVFEQNRITPFAAPSRADASATVLSESFESATGSSWLPQGWTIQSKGEESSPWTVGDATQLYVTGQDGNYSIFVNYTDQTADELLITPSVSTIDDGMALSFLYNVDPVYMYSLDNLDFDTMDWVGEKTVAYTLRVLASTDDGNTWETLLDMAELERYKSMSYTEAAQYGFGTVLEPFSVDVSKFAGKNVKFAFEYYGADGNSGVLDKIQIGYPSLNAQYCYPFSTLYYGMDRDLGNINFSVGIVPVYTPLTWYNLSEGNPDATSYSWAYHGPDNEQGSAEGDELTLTYHTDYTSDFSTRNNLYSSPELTASAPKSTAGTYKYLDYFQAGGVPEMLLKNSDTNESELVNFGMATFDINTDGIDITVGDDEKSSPIFGYNENVDKYWTDYTFNGDDEEGDYVHLEGIFNYYVAPEAPMVIKGGWVHAKGNGIYPDQEFKLEIIPLDEEGVMTQPIATASCMGADVKVVAGEGVQDFLTVCFEFDEPVVVSNADFDAYVVRFSGFRDCGLYFAPFQSAESNYAGMALGWIDKEISMGGEVRTSQTPVKNYTGKAQSFAIMLDSYYPWLEGEETVEIGEDGRAELPLDSYYSVSDLNFDGAPAWLTAGFSGTRYGDVKLLLKSTSEKADEGTLTLSSHGVKKTIRIKTAAVSSVNAVGVADRVVKEIFTAAGQRVADMSAPGIYLIRYTDGSVSRKIVK